MSKTNLVRFIQNIFPISDSKAKQIADKYVQKSIPKNDFILTEGHICSASHVIESGFLRGFIYDVDGNDVTISFYSKDTSAYDIFSFFKQVRSTENIQALTDCETWYMSYETMQESFHAIPEFREFGRLNLINNYGALKERMLSMIQETAEQRYVNLINSNPEILQIAPLKNIASYLGITDSSLSRIRKEFAKK
ncbi:MAG TPA: Crp/Fnr family transcriptional regulator [Flavipsychrobacter sp.]|nr:Crp/Fnr family transcriptional regulator [Flavipsychrobacter sp.]